MATVVCLLNGSTTVRERSSEDVTVLDCGCAHTRGEIQRWVQGCRRDFAPWFEKHEEVQRARVS